MKKFLAFVIVAILATSCIKEKEVKGKGSQFDVIISEIEQDGHSYLLFEGYGVVHNPDCGCKKVEE